MSGGTPLRQQPFGSTGLTVSEIGLGCSRLGSILSGPADEAGTLLDGALAMGVTFFDTSDLYGQGDSERLVGRHVGRRPGVVIASKIGKRHPFAMRVLMPLKAPLSRLLRRSASGAVRAARSRPVPTQFEPRYLAGALDRSLQRLGVATLDIMMLHSPGSEVLARGEAVGVLEAARKAGKIRVVGVSIDDVAAGQAALADPRIRALQIPLRPGETTFHALAAEAASTGVAVVAREIYGGAGRRPLDDAAIRSALRSVVRLPGVATALVGTTRGAHLARAAEALAR